MNALELIAILAVCATAIVLGLVAAAVIVQRAKGGRR